MKPTASTTPDLSTENSSDVACRGERHVAEDLGDMSFLQERQPSLPAAGDLSVVPRGTTAKLCDWCRSQLQATRPEARFCSRKCRQSAWRIRRRHQVETKADRSMRFAYADPPYPGFAYRLYKDQPSYAGEVNHAELIASLVDRYDGWALSTSAKALSDILPLCPKAARVCAWVKPIGASPLTYGIHNTCEPVIVVPGRSLRPGKRDWLSAQPARKGGELPGRKPIAFCAWLFELLGMSPGDELDDLFPGTGVVSRSWDELCRSTLAPLPLRISVAPGVDDPRQLSPSFPAGDDSSIDQRH